MSDAALRLHARYVQRPFLAMVPSQRALRALFELTSTFEPAPKDVTVTRSAYGGVPGLTFRPEGTTGPPKLLYFHGGGFTMGSPRTHRNLIGRLAREAGVVAFAPDYRLSPEHKFPTAHDDALAVYDAMELPVAVAGDSAGGNLSAYLCLERAPVAAALLSPALDFARWENADVDFRGELLIPPAWLTRVAKAMGDIDPTDRRLTPLPHLDGRVPTIVQVGAGEILRYDAETLAARTGAQIEIFDGVPHVWQMHGAWSPSARRSIRSLGAFLKSHL
ncbi:MAG: alpha/beta hydrolase [Pseudomonadota bacterium]